MSIGHRLFIHPLSSAALALGCSGGATSTSVQAPFGSKKFCAIHPWAPVSKSQNCVVVRPVVDIPASHVSTCAEPRSRWSGGSLVVPCWARTRKTVALPVSAPFHCALMEPAAKQLAPELAKLTFSDAKPPVITNVEAKPNQDAARIQSLLVDQVTAPVRFNDMVAEMKSLGVDSFLEVGPGRVLSGLIARIERRARRANFSSLADLDDVREWLDGSAS